MSRTYQARTPFAMRQLSALALIMGASLGTSACSNRARSAITFAFDRPEYVAMVCVDKGSDNGLPMYCCAPNAGDVPLASPDSPYQLPPQESPQRASCTGSEPGLFALVTQSVRGEVAAVDLEAHRIEDSDRRIPGGTFIDVGGQPTAVVAPLERPTPGYDPTDAPEGPPWVYIASAADDAVRAVATCRFPRGKSCGPEENLTSEQLTMFLGGTPLDMIEGPDEALWVSVPAAGALVRVQLAPSVGPDGQPPPASNLPFLEPTDTAQNPMYFAVPMPTSYELKAPVFDEPYMVTCGLDHNYEPGEVLLPSAPRAGVDPNAKAAPTRLRYDAATGLLFVADANLPVIHVFSLDTDGTLTTRGAMPVGQVLKDFVLTPEVPVASPNAFGTAPVSDPNAPSTRYLYGLDQDGLLLAFELSIDPVGHRAAVEQLLAPAPLRYSDRMQLFPAPAVGVALEVVDTRPNSPENCGTGKVPELDPVTELPTGAVVDGQVQPDGLTSIVEQLSTQLDQAKAALATAQRGSEPNALQLAQTELNKAQRRFDIARQAAPNQLRGVFLFVVTLAGEVNVYDIVDLDVTCRAQTSCGEPEPNPEDGGMPEADAGMPEQEGVPETHPLLTGDLVQNGTVPAALAVQRHAPRLTSSREPFAQVSSTALFNEPVCEPMYTPADRDDSEQPLCLIADPWAMRAQTWTLQTDRRIPGLQLEGFFQRPEGLPADQLIVEVDGVSLCGRGALDNVDDVVAIRGGIPANLAGRGDCQVPAAGNEPRLKIVEAHDGYLVLRALGLTETENMPGDSDDAQRLALAELTDADSAEPFAAWRATVRANAEREVGKLLACYPQGVNFEVRTGNTLAREGACPSEDPCYLPPQVVLEDGTGGMPQQLLTAIPNYFVEGSSSTYLHRTIKDPAGDRCIDDPEKDPRLRARAQRTKYFENTQLSFILEESAPSSVSIGVNQGTLWLIEGTATPDLPAARPTMIRYFPYTQDLYMVDSATQGVRRLQLSPFRTDSSNVYR